MNAGILMMIFVIAIANIGGMYFYIQDKRNLKHKINTLREHLGGNFPPIFILFLSVGLIAPHPIRGYLQSLFLLFILFILNLLVSLLFSDLVSAEKSDPKSGVAVT